MKVKALLLSLMAAVIMCATSCNDNDNGNNQSLLSCIVTVESRTAAGAVFTFQRDGDSPVITYTTTQAVSSDQLTLGSRILITFYKEDNDQFTSGPISIVAAVPTIGGGASVSTATATETDNYNTSDVLMNQIWRTGKYLNIAFTAVTAPAYKECKLVADPNTLDDEYISLYMIFLPSDAFDNRDNYGFYLSYNIDGLASRSTCKGFKVFYKDQSSMMVSTTVAKGNAGMGSNISPQ